MIDEGRITTARVVQGERAQRVAAGYLLAVGALLAGIGWWLSQHIASGQWDSDEGIYLMWVQLWRAGYPLYSAIWVDQPPGFLLNIRVLFDLFGPSLATARLVPVTCAVMGLAGVAWMVRELGGGRLASLAAIGILAVAPDFFSLSRTLIADLPAMSLATLALASALHYQNAGRRGWLVLSGLLFAVALSVKLIVAPVLLPVGLTIFTRHWGKPGWLWSALEDGLLLVASLAIAFAPTLLLFEPGSLAQEVVATYFGSRDAYPWNPIEQFRTAIWPFAVGSDYGLTAITLFGLCSLCRRGWRLALVAGSWLGIILVSLVTHVPLWPWHHLVLLLFPMSVLGAMTVDELLRWRPGGRAAWLWLGVGCLALGLYLTNLPQTLAADRGRVDPPETTVLLEMAQRAHDFTQPGEFIMTDLPMIAFLADRLVPPALVDTSEKRITAGYLTDQDLVAAAEAYRPGAIALWRGKLAGFPEFMRWTKEHYRQVMRVDRKRQLFVRSESAE